MKLREGSLTALEQTLPSVRVWQAPPASLQVATPSGPRQLLSSWAGGQLTPGPGTQLLTVTCTVQYSTVQYSTVQYSTVQSVQYSTVQCTSEVVSLPPAEVEAVPPLVGGEAALLAHPATLQ